MSLSHTFNSCSEEKELSSYGNTGAQAYSDGRIGASYYELGEEMYTAPECSENQKSVRCQAGLMILTQIEQALERHKFALTILKEALAHKISLAQIEQTADNPSFLKAYLSTYLEHFSPEEIIHITEDTISRLEVLDQKYPHTEIMQQFVATFTAPKQDDEL